MLEIVGVPPPVAVEVAEPPAVYSKVFLSITELTVLLPFMFPLLIPPREPAPAIVIVTPEARP